MLLFKLFYFHKKYLKLLYFLILEASNMHICIRYFSQVKLIKINDFTLSLLMEVFYEEIFCYIYTNISDFNT